MLDLDINNLHHAYLCVGNAEQILPKVLKFIEQIGEPINGNPDFLISEYDVFKIDDARDFKRQTNDKKFGTGRRIFIISANQFLVEAQNALLKFFEEPKEETLIFVISPNVQTLLPTLLSRFYILYFDNGSKKIDKEAFEFIRMNISNRINYIKDLLAEAKDEEDDESPRTIAQNFLNNLEFALHEKMSKTLFGSGVFEHIFKVRENLRQPGSTPKMLLESIALVLPENMLK